MQRLDVQLEDDLTGGPADETVAFGIDGRSYEIDLSAQHAADFRRKLTRFIERARVARARRPRAAVRTSASRERSRQIRAWAQAQGFDLAAHGRLPRQIVAQYEREGMHSQQPNDGARRRHRIAVGISSQPPHRHEGVGVVVGSPAGYPPFAPFGAARASSRQVRAFSDRRPWSNCGFISIADR